MPDTSTQPPIIDLTEIVEKTGSASGPRLTEQEKLSGHVSDLMKAGGSDDDVGLDDLLAQLNDGQEQEDSGADVDPHERLSMPGMDEMDAVFGQFGAPAAGGKPGAEARAQTAPADSELDDLLDLGEPLAKPAAAPADELDAQAGDEPDVLDLGEPIAKPAAAASADGLDDLLADLDAPVVRPTAKPAAAPAPADGLDDLLADLDGPAVKPTAKPAAAPADGLDDLLADLDGPVVKPTAKPAAAAPAPADGLDDLLADLDAPVVRPTAKPASAPAPADGLDDLLADLDGPAVTPAAKTPPVASPAVAPQGGKVDEMLNNLLEGLDVPPSGPMDRPGHVEGGDDRHLEELLDSARGVPDAPAGGAGAVSDLEILRAEQARLEQAIGALRERLAEVEAGLSGLAPAALTPEQLSGVAGQVMAAMRVEIEKAAAASAAKVIREEISALFNES